MKKAFFVGVLSVLFLTVCNNKSNQNEVETTSSTPVETLNSSEKENMNSFARFLVTQAL